MKILIIDNGTLHLRALEHRLTGHDVVVSSYRSPFQVYADSFDLVILTGGHVPVQSHHKYYSGEINIILNSKQPVIGICLGHELIARAFGESPKKLLRRIHGIRPILIDDFSSGGQGRTAKVYKAHKFVVKKSPKDFEKLAESKHGIEIMRHNKRPIFGLQFHPEVIDPKNDGLELFNYVFRLATANIK